MLRIPVCMHNVEDDEIFRLLHGTLSEWIKKALIIGHVETLAQFINKIILKGIC